VLIVLWGCTGLPSTPQRRRPPTPQREWVTLKTSSSTQYYSVRGTTNFHLEDEAKIQEGRKPLQAQIDQTLVDLKRQRDTTRAAIDAVKAEMAKSGASFASCSQSRLTRRIQALCQQYNKLAAAYNALVDQSNGVASRRNSLADEHNRVVAVISNLIEDLNWTR
jgi:chromosome segregation ATPase